MVRESYGEARGKQVSGRIFGERIAHVLHSPHPWQTDAVFFLSRHLQVRSSNAGDDLLSPFSLSAPSFLRSVVRRQIIERDQSNDHRTFRLFSV
jgi:hypothetical protein